MDEDKINIERRKFLTGAASVIGGIGAAFAASPFVMSWLPSERAKALGAPIEVDVSHIPLGAQLTVKWRDTPVWIIHRTPETLHNLPDVNEKLRDPFSAEAQQPEYAKNLYRSIKEKYLVLIGICTHLGCVPNFRPDLGGVEAGWPGGFFCPCHGSKFDLAGRVYKGVPAPLNLPVPPHRYTAENIIIIGEDEKV